MMSPVVKNLAAIALIALLGFAFFGACEKTSENTGSGEVTATQPAKNAENQPAKVEKTAEPAMTIQLSIEGMTCAHCQNTVTKALANCDGVVSAVVDLEGKSAVVKGDGIDAKALTAAVAKKGYTAKVLE